MGRSVIIKLAIYFFLTFVIISGVIAYIVLEDSPCLQQNMQAGVDDALKARRLVHRSVFRLLRNTDTAVVYASEEELNSLMLFISRGVKKISGSIKVAPEGIDADVCLRLPRNPFGSYMNVRLGIKPSREGLNIKHASFGSVRVSGESFIYFLRFLLDLFMGDEGGSAIINSVHSIQIHDRWAVIRFNAVPELRTRLAKVKDRWKFVRESVSFQGDPDTVRVYYQKLVDLDRSIPEGQVSLDAFMKPLFQFAGERGGDPARENQAALLALSLFLGSQRIEDFIGPVRTEELRAYRLRHPQVILAKRNDLRMHFLISAALKIISDSGISYAVGEFKELIDAGRGGSGFSFADLAADRAGIKFAETAVDTTSSARWVQSIMTGDLNEEMFFPDISGLPEGLSKAAFEKYFGNVESDEYRSLVVAIDRCIDGLPVYRQLVNKGEPEHTGVCQMSVLMSKYMEAGGR